MQQSFAPGIHNALSAVVVGLLVGLPVDVCGSPQRPGLPSVEGLWEQVDDDGRVGGWFHIYERNSVFVGDLVKIFFRPGEKASPICTKCSGDQKNQPMLGLTLIKGMQRKGLNYEKGSILDPDSGSVYQARMELSPDGRKLMVRGFLGIDLFGQSQIWRKLPDSAMAEVASTLAATSGQIPRGSSAPAPGNPALVPAASPHTGGIQQKRPPRSNGLPLRGSVQ